MAQTKEFMLSMSRTGIPTVAVGGGGYTNTYEGRAVFKQYRDGKYRVKKAIFVRSHGSLACERDQAFVPVSEGDYIVEYTGSYPILMENPNAGYSAYRIVSIDLSDDLLPKAITEKNNLIKWDDVHDANVLQGLRTYHNRDGSLFCIAP